MAGVTVVPGQMALDLFPDERPARKSPLESCIEILVSEGCDEGVVRPIASELFSIFGSREGFDRAHCLSYFYGNRRIPGLQACSPMGIGMFDRSIDYHVIWDRCWAARWAPLIDVFEVKEWVYHQHRSNSGAPEYIWYIDNEGREVKRPHLEEECER